MPGNKTNYFNCVLCSKRTKANERREVSRAIKKILRKTCLIDSLRTMLLFVIDVGIYATKIQASQ